MPRDFMCCSHTISGVAPGSLRASRHPLAARLAACGAAGYRGCWLHLRDYQEQKAAGFADGAMRELFDSHGLVHRGVEFLTDWFLDDRTAERTAFDAADAVGAAVINAGGDFLMRGFPRAHMLDRFAALCARAADRGLSIALEIVPWSDVPDIDAALEFLGPPNAGIALDCWHLFRGRSHLSDIARIPAERILCVQVNDAAAMPAGPLHEDTLDRRFCGEGAFDLAGFVAAIESCGATVPFSVEIISPDIAAMPLDEAARRSFATARKAFPARA
jgi:sugar phosphate isomerase/epimerase